MEGYLGSPSLGEESLQMWNLNKRLEAYLSRVSALEEENELLRSEIHSLKGTQAEGSWRNKYEDELNALRDTLNESFREKNQVELERDSLFDEIELVKRKWQQERQAQEDVKKELAESKKVLEEERRAQIWLKEKTTQLENELEALVEVHEADRADLEQEIATFSQSMENFRVAPMAFQPVDIEDYSKRLSEVWKGTVENYKSEVSSLEGTLTESKEKLWKVTEENRQNQSQLQDLEKELLSLKRRKEMLEEHLSKEWHNQQEDIERFQLDVESLEQEKQALRVQIAHVLEDRQQLMHLKMSLSLEVATYRTLLEAESTRLHMPLTDYKQASPLRDSRLEFSSSPIQAMYPDARKFASRESRFSPSNFKKGEHNTPLQKTQHNFQSIKTTTVTKSPRPVTVGAPKVSQQLQSQNVTYTNGRSLQRATPVTKVKNITPTSLVSEEITTDIKVERQSKSVSSHSIVPESDIAEHTDRATDSRAEYTPEGASDKMTEQQESKEVNREELQMKPKENGHAVDAQPGNEQPPIQEAVYMNQLLAEALEDVAKKVEDGGELIAANMYVTNSEPSLLKAMGATFDIPSYDTYQEQPYGPSPPHVEAPLKVEKKDAFEKHIENGEQEDKCDAFKETDILRDTSSDQILHLEEPAEEIKTVEFKDIESTVQENTEKVVAEQSVNEKNHVAEFPSTCEMFVTDVQEEILSIKDTKCEKEEFQLLSKETREDSDMIVEHVEHLLGTGLQICPEAELDNHTVSGNEQDIPRDTEGNIEESDILEPIKEEAVAGQTFNEENQVSDIPSAREMFVTGAQKEILSIEDTECEKEELALLSKETSKDSNMIVEHVEHLLATGLQICPESELDDHGVIGSEQDIPSHTEGNIDVLKPKTEEVVAGQSVSEENQVSDIPSAREMFVTGAQKEILSIEDTECEKEELALLSKETSKDSDMIVEHVEHLLAAGLQICPESELGDHNVIGSEQDIPSHTEGNIEESDVLKPNTEELVVGQRVSEENQVSDIPSTGEMFVRDVQEEIVSVKDTEFENEELDLLSKESREDSDMIVEHVEHLLGTGLQICPEAELDDQKVIDIEQDIAIDTEGNNEDTDILQPNAEVSKIRVLHMTEEENMRQLASAAEDTEDYDMVSDVQESIFFKTESSAQGAELQEVLPNETVECDVEDQLMFEQEGGEEEQLTDATDLTEGQEYEDGADMITEQEIFDVRISENLSVKENVAELETPDLIEEGKKANENTDHEHISKPEAPSSTENIVQPENLNVEETHFEDETESVKDNAFEQDNLRPEPFEAKESVVTQETMGGEQEKEANGHGGSLPGESESASMSESEIEHSKTETTNEVMSQGPTWGDDITHTDKKESNSEWVNTLDSDIHKVAEEEESDNFIKVEHLTEQGELQQDYETGQDLVEDLDTNEEQQDNENNIVLPPEEASNEAIIEDETEALSEVQRAEEPSIEVPKGFEVLESVEEQEAPEIFTTAPRVYQTQSQYSESDDLVDSQNETSDIGKEELENSKRCLLEQTLPDTTQLPSYDDDDDDDDDDDEREHLDLEMKESVEVVTQVSKETEVVLHGEDTAELVPSAEECPVGLKDTVQQEETDVTTTTPEKEGTDKVEMSFIKSKDSLEENIMSVSNQDILDSEDKFIDDFEKRDLLSNVQDDQDMFHEHDATETEAEGLELEIPTNTVTISKEVEGHFEDVAAESPERAEYVIEESEDFIAREVSGIVEFDDAEFMLKSHQNVTNTESESLRISERVLETKKESTFELNNARSVEPQDASILIAEDITSEKENQTANANQKPEVGSSDSEDSTSSDESPNATKTANDSEHEVNKCVTPDLAGGNGEVKESCVEVHASSGLRAIEEMSLTENGKDFVEKEAEQVIGSQEDILSDHNITDLSKEVEHPTQTEDSASDQHKEIVTEDRSDSSDDVLMDECDTDNFEEKFVINPENFLLNPLKFTSEGRFSEESNTEGLNGLHDDHNTNGLPEFTKEMINGHSNLEESQEVDVNTQKSKEHLESDIASLPESEALEKTTLIQESYAEDMFAFPKSDVSEGLFLKRLEMSNEEETNRVEEDHAMYSDEDQPPHDSEEQTSEDHNGDTNTLSHPYAKGKSVDDQHQMISNNASFEDGQIHLATDQHLNETVEVRSGLKGLQHDNDDAWSSDED